MERWAAPAPARDRTPRRRPGQPSFSSTLLDAICDAMDDQPGGANTAADTTPVAATAARKQRDAAAMQCYYYYKPSLAASHRAARVAEAPAADDCHGGRGYFSSSEVEHSLRRLRPIRTSGSGRAAPQPENQQRKQPQATAEKARKPASCSARCRRPASPGARLAGLLNAIFTGKRHSERQHPSPPDDEPTTTAPSSTARRPRFATTPPPPSARASRSRRSRSRTVRFLDIDGEVAVAAAVAGCRHIPVVEVEEVLFRPAADNSDVGEESSDASSDLFELENLDPAGGGGGGGQRRACGDELPVYGTTGVGIRRDIGRRRPFGYATLGRSYSRVL